MASGKIILGFMIDESSFLLGTDSENFVLQKLRESGILKFLTYKTTIYEDGVKQFYLNSTVKRSQAIESCVLDNRFQISASSINSVLRYAYDIPFSDDLRKRNREFLIALRFNDFGNPKIKKSCLSEEGKILTDVVEKCIICKDTAWDTFTQTQIQLQGQIYLGEIINWGELFMIMLRDMLVRIIRGTFFKNPFGRLISILLSVIIDLKDSAIKGKKLDASKVIEGFKRVVFNDDKDETLNLTIELITEPVSSPPTLTQEPPTSLKPSHTSTLVSFKYVPIYRLRDQGDQSIKLLPLNEPKFDDIPEEEITRKEKSKMSPDELKADVTVIKDFTIFDSQKLKMSPATKTKLP